MILLAQTLDPSIIYPTAGAAGALLIIVTTFTIKVMAQANRDRKAQTEIISAQSGRIEQIERSRMRDQVECNTRIDELEARLDRKDNKINYLVAVIYKSEIAIPEEFWRL